MVVGSRTLKTGADQMPISSAVAHEGGGHRSAPDRLPEPGRPRTRAGGCRHHPDPAAAARPVALAPLWPARHESTKKSGVPLQTRRSHLFWSLFGVNLHDKWRVFIHVDGAHDE